MKVTTSELRQATQALLDHLDGLGQKTFVIDEDYYWSIPAEACYDAAKPPADLTLGQLSDDLDEIRAINAGTREPVGYALVWLAAILRRVGEKSVG